MAGLSSQDAARFADQVLIVDAEPAQVAQLDQMSAEHGHRYTGVLLVDQFDDWIVAARRPGLDRQRRALFDAWARERFRLMFEGVPPEQDGWLRRSDGRLQMYAREAIMPALDEPRRRSLVSRLRERLARRAARR